MTIRDAAETDAEAIAGLVGTATGAAARMIRRRTVRVAVDNGAVRGVVSFDISSDAVQITRLSGDRNRLEELLSEPLRYAAREDLATEMLLPRDARPTRELLEANGFVNVEAGPAFQNEETLRYRRPADQ